MILLVRIFKLGGEPLGSSQMELGNKLETNASTFNLEAKVSWPTIDGEPLGSCQKLAYVFLG